MKQPTPDAIVVSGQWIEIARAEDGDNPSELIRLSDVRIFPFAQNANIPHPDTGVLLPVPYGNLTSYAEHLAKEWGDDAKIRILFHRTFDATVPLDHLLNQDAGTQMTEEELQQAIVSGKARLLNQDDKVIPPSDTTKTS
jgi:hypothetical protein